MNKYRLSGYLLLATLTLFLVAGFLYGMWVSVLMRVIGGFVLALVMLFGGLACLDVATYVDYENQKKGKNG